MVEAASGYSDPSEQAGWVRDFLGARNVYQDHCTTEPRLQRVEDALTALWRELNSDTARRYLRYMRAVVPMAAQQEAQTLAATLRPPEPLGAEGATRWYGDWQATLKLGGGGDGDAFLATHAITGQVATIKTPCRGEGFVWMHLSRGVPQEWHPRLVRIFDGGTGDLDRLRPCEGVTWVAREYADTSLFDTYQANVARSARSGRRWCLPRNEVLEIFGMACEVVAWLHAHQVYRWSAHLKNILRCRGAWQVADLGRSPVFIDEEHWATAWQREMVSAWLPPDLELPTSWWTFVAAVRRASFWGHWTCAGFWPRDPELEDRLRREDCAALGGLLCQLLTGSRFDHFRQALSGPLCSATYRLSGSEEIDRRLSQILNRAWLGDGGGALELLAKRSRRRDRAYSDSLALLADVSSVVGVNETTPRS